MKNHGYTGHRAKSWQSPEGWVSQAPSPLKPHVLYPLPLITVLPMALLHHPSVQRYLSDQTLGLPVFGHRDIFWSECGILPTHFLPSYTYKRPGGHNHTYRKPVRVVWMSRPCNNLICLILLSPERHTSLGANV